MLRRLEHVPYTIGWEMVGLAGGVAVTLEDEAENACLILRDRRRTAQVEIGAQGLLELAAALVEAAERLQAR